MCRSLLAPCLRPAVSCLLLAITGIAAASPLPTRDQNPLLAGFGLPRPMPTQLPASSWEFSADFNWGSTALVQNTAHERLLVDAETRELRLSLNGRLSDRWLVALSVPYRSTSGGSLDGFIDGWHDFFGLPDGARSSLIDDQLQLSYARAGVTQLDRHRSASGIGDTSLAAGWQIKTAPDSALTGWVELKLPTGSSSDLTGSGAMDISAIVAGERRFGERWSIFAQAGATRLGRGDLFTAQQQRWVGSAMAGISARFWPHVELTAQIDGHTAAFDDTELDYLNEAVILNLGGAILFDSGWRLSLGVSEDILVEASPDVVFVLGVRRAR